MAAKCRKLQATTLLPLEIRKVAWGNTVILSPKLCHQSSVMPYSIDNRSIHWQHKDWQWHSEQLAYREPFFLWSCCNSVFSWITLAFAFFHSSLICQRCVASLAPCKLACLLTVLMTSRLAGYKKIILPFIIILINFKFRSTGLWQIAWFWILVTHTILLQDFHAKINFCVHV